jgi:putative Mn2+ efflux pump MntP
VDGGVRVRVAIIFGFFEAVMPLVGLLLGHRVASSIGSAGSYLGGGLLIATGGYAFFQARRNPPHHAPVSARAGRLIFTGAALSIDNLVIGFALGTYTVPIVVAAIVIAVVSVGMSLVGLEVGDRLAAPMERWSSEIGGVVLILVGAAIASGLF